MENCNHQFNDSTVCVREKNHSNNHYKLWRVGDGEFQSVEWNDNRETRPMEHGAAFQCDFYANDDQVEKIVELAIFDARKTLPKGTVFEIRAKNYPPKEGEPVFTGDYGRHIDSGRRDLADQWGIAWYAVFNAPFGFEYLETPKEPICRYPAKKGEINKLGGYVLIARLAAK